MPPSESWDDLSGRSIALEELETAPAVRIKHELKVDTGFSSWQQYAKSLEDDFIYNRPTPMSDYALPLYDCSIVDVLLAKNSPPKISLRCNRLSPSQAYAALRDSPSNVSVQVLLSKLPFDRRDWEDTLGLGLRLDPRFLMDLDGECARLSVADWDEENLHGGSGTTYLLTGGLGVTIVRQYSFAKPDPIPIVLVAGDLNDIFLGVATLDTKAAFYDFVHGFPPSEGSARKENRSSQVYTRLLSVSMERHQKSMIDRDTILLGCLLPVLRLDILRMRSTLLPVRNLFFSVRRAASHKHQRGQACLTDDEDMTSDKLFQELTVFRSRISELDNQTPPLTRYISLQISIDLLQSPMYLQHIEEKDCVIQEARRLEADIRDYLQVQVGQLALQESRKSIELANYQIREGKRGT